MPLKCPYFFTPSFSINWLESSIVLFGFFWLGIVCRGMVWCAVVWNGKAWPPFGHQHHHWSFSSAAKHQVGAKTPWTWHSWGGSNNCLWIIEKTGFEFSLCATIATKYLWSVMPQPPFAAQKEPHCATTWSTPTNVNTRHLHQHYHEHNFEQWQPFWPPWKPCR